MSADVRDAVWEGSGVDIGLSWRLLLFVWCVLPAGPICAGEAAAGDERWPETLAGTQHLESEQPLDRVMVSGLRRFCLRELAAAPRLRDQLWAPFLSSADTLRERAEERRGELRRLLGVVDPRVTGAESLAGLASAVDAAGTWGFEGPSGGGLRRVRWPVLSGVTAEGLLVVPEKIRGAVVLVPDTAWTPEMLCGVSAGAEVSQGLVGRLVEAGCVVVVPALISRGQRFSGNADVVLTNQSHREYLYRQSFVVGRHVAGYEVQKVLAAVDLLERWLRAEAGAGAVESLPIGVGGVGEGGRIAMAAAAVDRRIRSCWVAGYFQQREGLWQEPIDRNVWRLLTEFGDAEQAGLIAPRTLVLEACRVPEFRGVAEELRGRAQAAAPGRVEVCEFSSVRAEAERSRKFYAVYGAESRLQLFGHGADGMERAGVPGSRVVVDAFLKGFLPDAEVSESAGGQVAGAVALVSGGGEPVAEKSLGLFADERERRQLDELQEHVQRLIRGSQRVRDAVWLVAPGQESGWPERQRGLRAVVQEELIGRVPQIPRELRPRSRRILETAEYVGYEVWLEVFEDVVAGGVLLLPRGLSAGEQRAVVVCQHGLEGTPLDTISREPGSYAAYRAFSEELVRRGYIVFAPQNPYRGGDDFRVLQRMSNPLGRSLFSLIVSQHQQLLRWLKTVPGVDADRIGFYGLSYGGKTAMRVPALLEEYRLSICSGDFTDWPRTIASNDERYSYVFTGEYEIPEWNLAHVSSYAEFAQLISPRPFMVEAGHRDGGQPTELVSGEFGRVRRHFDRLGIAERAELEFFDGPHRIHAVGTFEFLDRHLRGANGGF